MICDRQVVNHRITHNGDFDAWTIFDDSVENDLGLWLDTSTAYPNATRTS